MKLFFLGILYQKATLLADGSNRIDAPKNQRTEKQSRRNSQNSYCLRAGKLFFYPFFYYYFFPLQDGLDFSF